MTNAARLVFFTTLLSGCIALPVPHERYVTPNVSGVVRYAATQEPVAGATVTISSDGGLGNSKPSCAAVLSDAQGKFLVGTTERAKCWYLILLAPFEGFCIGKIAASHPNFDSIELDVG
jgi:hypothetical protein